MNKAVLDVNTPLSQLVNEVPRAALIFEELWIDFCWDGQKSLAEACAEAGFDPNEILAGLYSQVPDDTSPPEKDWSKATLSELADHIETTHHAYAKEALPRLAFWAEKVVSTHGKHRPDLLELREIIQKLLAEMGPHMEKEERELFPAVRKLDAPQVRFPFDSIKYSLRAMEKEHDDLAKVFTRIRHLTRDYAPPEDACETCHALFKGLKALEEDTHLHGHKEHNILFPRAVEVERMAKFGMLW